METVSGLQKRLLSLQEDNRSFSPFQLVDLAVHFSKLFEEDSERGRVGFVGTPADLRAVLDELLIIVGFLEIDAGTAVRRKYRNKCPRCLEKPCVCWNRADKPPYKRFGGRLPNALALAETQKMLDEVFPRRHTLAQEVQCVRDEIAELAEAFLYKGKADQEEEVADVFAWLARVSSTLGIPLEGLIG